MKEFFRLNRHVLNKEHDLWIVMKEKFTRKEGEILEIEELFLQALHKINHSYNFKGK
jgi:hypothetical protein